MKKFMSRKMKIFLSVLATISISSYIGAAIILYNSDFKISNYISKWTNDFDFDFDFDGHVFRNIGTLEKDFPSDVEAININTSSADVKINFYDGATLKFEASTSTLRDIDISTVSNEIHSPNNILSININNPDYSDINVNIYIPSNYKNSLKFKSTSGDLDIIAGYLENVSINSTSGEIEINNLIAENLNIQSTSGDIDLYLNNLGTNSKISSISGDIDLFISKSIGYTLTFDTVSGDIKTDGTLMNFITDNNYTLTNGDGNKNIEIKTTSGSLHVK